MRGKNFMAMPPGVIAIICLLVSLSLTQGCGLGVLAAGIGYTVSASKKGDAAVAEAEAKLQQSYNQYKLEMERIDLEQEKNKMQPRPIMTIDEWLRWQAIPEDMRADLVEKRAPRAQEPPSAAPAPSADQPLQLLLLIRPGQLPRPKPFIEIYKVCVP